MRLVGKLGLLILGLFGGFMAAAALVKRAVPSRGDAESDEVALRLISPLRPGLLRSDADDFSYLIMPIRLAG